MDIESLIQEVDSLEEELFSLNTQHEQLSEIIGECKFNSLEEALAAAPAELKEAMEKSMREIERASEEAQQEVVSTTSVKAPMSRRGMMRI